uniref:ATP-dependent RNA helicase n=2 Tax=Lygus hesperus TaxID=30085 RepID=A0A0A9WFM6_LYGHE
MEQQPHIVVATPGRLLDILGNDKQLSSSLRNIKYFVLDEADRLLQSEMVVSVKKIVQYLPHKDTFQTLLFSATIEPSTLLSCIAGIRSQQMIVPLDIVDMPIILSKPIISKIFKDDTNFVNTLDQRYIYVPRISKDVYTTTLLQMTKRSDPQYDPMRLILVFVSTCRTAIMLSSLLQL